MKNTISVLTRGIPMLVLLLMFASGCKTSGEHFSEVPSLTNRIEMVSVSLLPPQEEGWQFEKKHPGRLEFRKLGDSKTQSFIGMVELSKFPPVQSEAEFLKVISEQRKRDSGDPRYEDILNKETMSYEKNTIAVRFHTRYKDFGAKNLPKGETYLVVEDYGIICRHPNHANVAVYMAFSQRTLPTEASKTLQRITDDFIKNAEFIKWNNKGEEGNASH